MMFQTELKLPPSPEKISMSHSILSVGSCFAANMGDRMEQDKFNILVNPFGVIYNPVSLFRLIKSALEDGKPSGDTFVESQGMWYSYDLHSDVAGTDHDSLESNIAEVFSQVNRVAQKADWFMITLGTAFAYQRKDTGEIVANCHKIPQKEFDRILLSRKAILAEFELLHALLPENSQILLSVSPVRHIRDGLDNNSVSKSVLRVTCDALQKTFSNVHYFPAFEIMIDELRDYRFYADDMLHPSKMALEILWERFSSAYFDKDTLSFISEWEKLLRDVNHRPFNPASPEHQEFLKRTMKKLLEFGEKVDVSKEKQIIETQLA